MNEEMTRLNPCTHKGQAVTIPYKTIVLFIVNSDKSLFNQPILIVLISRMNPYLAKRFFDRVCVTHLVLSYYVSLCSEFHVVDVHQNFHIKIMSSWPSFQALLKDNPEKLAT
jgi:hypothetical protein